MLQRNITESRVSVTYFQYLGYKSKFHMKNQESISPSQGGVKKKKKINGDWSQDDPEMGIIRQEF